MSARHILGSVTAALLLTGCARGDGDPTALLLNPGDTPDQTVFLALSERPDGVMEALFQGRVLRDAAGCLRLDTAAPEDATVVWPFGSGLQVEGETLTVVDAEGDTIGRIGGSFRFGGGFVQTLHGGIPLTEADRAEATSRCPGSYWIVGEIL